MILETTGSNGSVIKAKVEQLSSDPQGNVNAFYGVLSWGGEAASGFFALAGQVVTLRNEFGEPVQVETYEFTVE